MKTKRKISCKYGKTFLTATFFIHLSFLTEANVLFLNRFPWSSSNIRNIIVLYTYILKGAPIFKIVPRSWFGHTGSQFFKLTIRVIYFQLRMCVRTKPIKRVSRPLPDIYNYFYEPSPKNKTTNDFFLFLFIV